MKSEHENTGRKGLALRIIQAYLLFDILVIFLVIRLQFEGSRGLMIGAIPGIITIALALYRLKVLSLAWSVVMIVSLLLAHFSVLILYT